MRYKEYANLFIGSMFQRKANCLYPIAFLHKFVFHFPCILQLFISIFVDFWLSKPSLESLQITFRQRKTNFLYPKRFTLLNFFFKNSYVTPVAFFNFSQKNCYNDSQSHRYSRQNFVSSFRLDVNKNEFLVPKALKAFPFFFRKIVFHPLENIYFFATRFQAFTN